MTGCTTSNSRPPSAQSPRPSATVADPQPRPRKGRPAFGRPFFASAAPTCGALARHPTRGAPLSPPGTMHVTDGVDVVSALVAPGTEVAVVGPSIAILGARSGAIGAHIAGRPVSDEPSGPSKERRVATELPPSCGRLSRWADCRNDPAVSVALRGCRVDRSQARHGTFGRYLL